MSEDQLESHLATLFSDFVAPEPDPPPRPLTEPQKAGTPACVSKAEAKRVTESRPYSGVGIAPAGAPAGGVAAASAEFRSYPGLPARRPGRLNELVLAIGYPLVIGLIEAVTLWGHPRWGFGLYSLVLLTLLGYATFGKETRLGQLCLVLTLVPTIQILGLSTAWGEFRFVQNYLILSGLLLLMIYLALNYLVTHFGPTSLGSETGFWGVPAYILVPLVGMPAVLVTYQALKFVLLGNAPITVNAIAPLLLIGLLVLKELTSTSEGNWHALGQFLNITIGPLLLAFCINVAMRILDVLK